MNTVAERFWSKVEGDPLRTDACWLWTGHLDRGYGRFRVSAKQSMKWVHRVSYEMLVGPIPEGLELDHLCRVRNCINPAHLEPVTKKVNDERADKSGNGKHPGNGSWHRAKTHCPKGHEYTPENTRLKNGWRNCIECGKAQCRAYYLSRKNIDLP